MVETKVIEIKPNVTIHHFDNGVVVLNTKGYYRVFSNEDDAINYYETNTGFVCFETDSDEELDRFLINFRKKDK